MGWCLLSAAGEEATGATIAFNREAQTKNSVREQLARLDKNTKRVAREIAKQSGIQRRADYLIEFDDGEIIIEYKRGKGRPPTEEEQKELLERISRAVGFIESGDLTDIMDYDWNATEDEIASRMSYI